MDNKQRIIEEAAVMFRTFGIRSVTMDMLANQMGISKRTIYEVFEDKDDLLSGVLKWMALKQEKLSSRVLEESENVIEAIFKLLDIMTEHFHNMSPAFRMDMKRFHNDMINKFNKTDELPYYNNNAEILKRGIEEGIFRKDLDIMITNKCLMEVMKMSGDKDVSAEDDLINEDVIRDFFINYLRGISTQKGLELINFYKKKGPILINGQHFKDKE